MAWPPVLIVTGNEGFLRRRFVSEVLETMRGEGRAVDYADAKVRGSISSILDGGAFLSTKTVIVVSNPDKADPEFLDSHYATGDSTYVLLCVLNGNPDGRTEFGKIVKKLDRVHRAFPAPTNWKAEEVAVSFCIEEAKRFGKNLNKRSAQALVSVIGSDLGILHFEVLKAVTLAESHGSSDIETSHIKGAIAPIAEADVFPAIRALEEKDLKRVLHKLSRIKVTSKTDPTIKVCRIMGATVTKWLVAATLDEDGFPPKEAASMADVKNAWYYENKVLPPARLWGREGLLRIARALALSERAVFAGHTNPWVGLQSRLASAFQDR